MLALNRGKKMIALYILPSVLLLILSAVLITQHKRWGSKQNRVIDTVELLKKESELAKRETDRLFGPGRVK